MQPLYRRGFILSSFVATLGLTVWAGHTSVQGRDRPPADSPAVVKPPLPLKKGNAQAGREVFRFETFGTEGFWTDVVRVPQGMKQAHVTLLAALRNGVNIDADRIPSAIRQSLSRESKTNLSARNAPAFNSPETMNQLVQSSAVIGLVPKNGKIGVTCALCHTITDASVFALPGEGSIGRRIDGPTPHSLNVGKLLAMAANSRALYPILQHETGSKTIGRAPKGLTPNSTEAQVDAYLSNPKYFPVGTFDDTPDGNGNSIHITPLFRQDLAAPFGSSGQNAKLEDFSNTVYTVLFDQTTLITSGGRKFLRTLAGNAGEKLADGYAHVLKATGVKMTPSVQASRTGRPGTIPSPVGLRVNNQKLLDLNAYLASLPAPRGRVATAGAVARGRELFRANCTSCHNVDQSRPVPAQLIPMKRIFPGYQPKVIAKRQPPLSPVQNSPGTFDDKMIVVDASLGGGIRGDALPLLLDLARKPVFLHDDSVRSLDALLNPRRGPRSPHPFYIGNASRRADLKAFLQSLDDRPRR
jgi:mono/diheme cytochrome c family protein